MSKIELVKVSSKGQLVLPKALRDELGIEAGSSLMLEKQDRAIILFPRPANALDALVELGTRMKLGDMRDEIKAHRRKEHR